MNRLIDRYTRIVLLSSSHLSLCIRIYLHIEIQRNGRVYVHEPKTKVDLTRIIETQAFVFDDAFDSHETNELIYARTIKPLVDFVFEGKL